jgi:hypothetical protein
MILTKEWNLSHGAFDKAKLLNRIHALNSNPNVRSLAPRHRFILHPNRIACNYQYAQRAEFVFGAHRFSLFSLATKLDALACDGIPHGDIKYANCVWDGQKWLLIDWEPILEYKTEDGVVFRTTKPYISSADLKNKCISTATDKLGFYFFVKRLKDGWQNPNSFNPFGIELQIMDYSFQEIFRLLDGEINNFIGDLHDSKEKAAA